MEKKVFFGISASLWSSGGGKSPANSVFKQKASIYRYLTLSLAYSF